MVTCRVISDHWLAVQESWLAGSTAEKYVLKSVLKPTKLFPVREVYFVVVVIVVFFFQCRKMKKNKQMSSSGEMLISGSCEV